MVGLIFVVHVVNLPNKIVPAYIVYGMEALFENINLLEIYCKFHRF